MYELNQVINGLEKYITNELLNQMSVLNQFLGGMFIGRVRNNAVDIFNRLKENPTVKMLNVINEEDKINVEELRKLANEQMEKKALTVEVPMLGIITFKGDDVEKLYTYIRG